jgi:hypothetical protein
LGKIIRVNRAPTFLVAAIALVLLGACTVSNHLRRPVSEIRESLLREKPIGTAIAEIESWLTAEKKLSAKKGMTGYFTDKGQVVGVRSVSVLLGEYRSYGILPTSVEAFWGFDANGALVDLWVRKSVDSL